MDQAQILCGTHVPPPPGKVYGNQDLKHVILKYFNLINYLILQTLENARKDNMKFAN